METDGGTVIIVDDDAAMRASLENLVRSVGLCALTHGSAWELLASPRPDTPACLVLDVRLPGWSGSTPARSARRSRRARR